MTELANRNAVEEREVSCIRTKTFGTESNSATTHPRDDVYVNYPSTKTLSNCIVSSDSVNCFGRCCINIGCGQLKICVSLNRLNLSTIVYSRVSRSFDDVSFGCCDNIYVIVSRLLITCNSCKSIGISCFKSASTISAKFIGQTTSTPASNLRTIYIN